MPFKVDSFWKNDKVKLIMYGFLLAITAFPIWVFAVGKLGDIFPRLGIDFFGLSSLYLIIYNWYMFKYIKKEKGKYFAIALIYFIFIQFIIIFILAMIFISIKIKWPKYGWAWVKGSIGILMTIVSYLLYNCGFKIIKKTIRKKQKAKGIVELNKFQENAKKKIEFMLKNIGAKYEEFKKIEKGNEVYLETGIEINGKFFAIEIGEEAITLAAEKEEDAFILELIDFEKANKLIEEFCKRAKEIFEKANRKILEQIFDL